MAYEIITEYTKLLQRINHIEKQLSLLPSGCITQKTVRGNQYFYLQKRISDKVSSTYIKQDDLACLTEKLQLRKEYESEFSSVTLQIERIEAAAKLLSDSLSRTLDILKLTAGMDDLSENMKSLCLSFSDAMTSIEGVAPSDTAKQELEHWKEGTASFLSVFQSTLKRYGFPVEV